MSLMYERLYKACGQASHLREECNRGSCLHRENAYEVTSGYLLERYLGILPRLSAEMRLTQDRIFDTLYALRG